MNAQKRCITLSILLEILCLAPVNGQDRYIAIIDKFIAKRAQYEAFSYDMELKEKIFTMEDTNSSLAKVELIRNQSDSLYGGIFSIDMDSIWYGYDGMKMMKGTLNNSTLTMGDPVKYLGLYVKSTWVDNFIDYGFLKKSSGIKSYLNDTTIQVTFSDTMIGDWPCLGILMDIPDEGEFQDRTVFIAIDTIEFYVRNRMQSVFFQDNEQYTNWTYKNVKYKNDRNIQKLDGSFETTFQNLLQYNEDSTQLQEYEKFDFERLSGNLYNKNEVFKITDVKASYIVLDFWYTSCYPCIKSIPSINAIYKDYKNKGVTIIGVNMYDEELKDKIRLEKFFKNNPLDYEIIFIDDHLRKDMHLEGYPTLIILDKEYKVIYEEVGFSEDLYDEVSSFLNSKL